MEKIFTILSIGLAVAAIISPICVALINNHHAKKLRIEELKHDETLNKIDANLRLSKKRLDIEFDAKKEAFANFFECANKYCSDLHDSQLFASLCSSAYKAASLCSVGENSSKLIHFVAFSKQKFDTASDDDKLKHLHNALSDLACVFAYELYKENISTTNN